MFWFTPELCQSNYFISFSTSWMQSYLMSLFGCCKAVIKSSIKDSALTVWLMVDMMEQNSELTHRNHELWWVWLSKTVQLLSPLHEIHTNIKGSLCIHKNKKVFFLIRTKMFLVYFSGVFGKKPQNTETVAELCSVMWFQGHKKWTFSV